MDTTTEKGGINNVVIDRQQLLGIVNDNLAKHNVIYEAAMQGYWKKLGRDLGKKWTIVNNLVHEVEEKMQKFQETGKFDMNFKNTNWSYYFGENRPENHEEDYKRVIKMLELSVHDKFCLNEKEFGIYVMNNWTWKKDFLSSTSNYMKGYSGFCGLSGYSGYSGVSGSGTSGYSGYMSMKEIKEILESF